MSNIKAREEIFTAIRQHGPVKHGSLSAYLNRSYTETAIDKAVIELVYLGRVAISKERQLTAR